jgi:putative peptidoglycan lipid II flippase
VSLPELAREAVGQAPNEQLRGRIALGVRRIVFFVAPSSLACIALNREIIGALYQTGQFTADATAFVGRVLAAYGVGLVGQATVRLFASGFYALRDTRTPVQIAAASLGVSTALAVVLMLRFGAPGIALASSLGAFLNTSLHLRHLGRRIGTVLQGRDWRAAAIALAASLGAAAAGVGAAHLGAGLGPVPRGVAVLAIFGVVYGVLTLALRHPDATRTWQSLTTWRAP